MVMKVFMVSLGMLFAAGLMGFLVIRFQQRDMWPDLPPLPRGLWLSTAILMVSSITMQTALVRARRGHSGRYAMLATTVLGIAFLVVQMMCWLSWRPVVQALFEDSQARYALLSFYWLTGIHALHVIGGLIPLAVITMHAFGGRYSTAYFPAVQYITMYWHFLGVVWIVLFAALQLGT